MKQVLMIGALVVRAPISLCHLAGLLLKGMKIPNSLSRNSVGELIASLLQMAILTELALDMHGIIMTVVVQLF
jgi:hypothetical protein